MCGIVGILERDSHKPAPRDLLERMTDAMAHRGPDERGIHIDGPLGLAVNYELDAVIEDATLGKDAAAMFLADLEQSTEIRAVPSQGA